MKKWKQICDKHNENVDYVNQDDFWDYTELPTKIGVLLFTFLLMYMAAAI